MEQQVLCALRFFGTGSFQGMVATDEHLSVSHMTVNRAVRVFAAAIAFFYFIFSVISEEVLISWYTIQNVGKQTRTGVILG